MAKKKTKLEIIDVNQDPAIREYKKTHCPWCDKTNSECTCPKDGGG